MGEPSNHFGSYRLISRLGKGGMGETWHAVRDDGNGVSKDVVIKRILRSVSDDPAFVEAFISEARLSARLSHGNVAQVFEFGDVKGEYFMAMEFVAGQSLHAALDRATRLDLRGVPPAFALYVAMEMLKGLHHAHKRAGADGKPLNIVHRDVSPDNVLLSYEGEVKIVDFGIAKATLTGRSETEPGFVKGKYLFFSPEQARGEPLDARTDVFSTGVVLFAMLAGRLPLEGQSHVVLHKLVRSEWPLLSSVAPWVPQPVERVVTKALAPDRQDRFDSALEFQQELGLVLREIAPDASQLTVSGMMSWLFAKELLKAGRATTVPPATQRMVTRHLQEAQVSRSLLSAPTSPGVAAVPTRQTSAARAPGGLGKWIAVCAAGLALTATAIYIANQDEQPRALGDLDQAKAAVERGELEKARKIIEICRSRGPCPGGDAILNSAQKKAIADATKPIGVVNRPLLMAEAEALIEAGKWDQARQQLEVVGDDDAKKKIAVLDAEKQNKTALDEAELRLQSDDVAGAKEQLALAQGTYYLRNRYDELTRRLDAAATEKLAVPKRFDPGLAGKLADQGRNQLRAKEYEGAKNSLTECIKVDPRAWDCAKLLGSAYAKLGDSGKSVYWYRRYLELAPAGDPDRAKTRAILDAAGQ
ncbi:MAG: protein kinase [Myxococcaceae bacterium]